jgi:hypothetical protein
MLSLAPAPAPSIPCQGGGILLASQSSPHLHPIPSRTRAPSLPPTRRACRGREARPLNGGCCTRGPGLGATVQAFGAEQRTSLPPPRVRSGNNRAAVGARSAWPPGARPSLSPPSRVPRHDHRSPALLPGQQGNADWAWVAGWSAPMYACTAAPHCAPSQDGGWRAGWACNYRSLERDGRSCSYACTGIMCTEPPLHLCRILNSISHRAWGATPRCTHRRTDIHEPCARAEHETKGNAAPPGSQAFRQSGSA